MVPTKRTRRRQSAPSKGTTIKVPRSAAEAMLQDLQVIREPSRAAKAVTQDNAYRLALAVWFRVSGMQRGLVRVPGKMDARWAIRDLAATAQLASRTITLLRREIAGVSCGTISAAGIKSFSAHQLICDIAKRLVPPADHPLSRPARLSPSTIDREIRAWRRKRKSLIPSERELRRIRDEIDLEHGRLLRPGAPQRPDDLVSSLRATELFDVSRATLGRAVAEGKLKSYRPPRCSKTSPHQFSTEELDRYYRRR